MVDTVRSLAAVVALLADNTVGDISPQDVRDMLVSLAMQHGQVSVVGNAVVTTIPDTTAFHEVDMTGAALSEQSQVIAGSDDFDMPVAGRLRYIGLQTRMFHVMATFSFITDSNLQEIHFQLANSGVVSVQAEVRRKTGTGTDVGSTAIHWITPLALNEYISLFAKNVSTASDLTIVSANIQAIGMIS